MRDPIEQLSDLVADPGLEVPDHGWVECGGDQAPVQVVLGRIHGQ